MPDPTCEAIDLRNRSEKTKAAIKAWHQAHPEKRRESSKLFVRNHPEKKRAQLAIQYRVRKGLISRPPCEMCGTPNAHAHHGDYSQKLLVKWLCPVCHGKEHRAY